MSHVDYPPMKAEPVQQVHSQMVDQDMSAASSYLVNLEHLGRKVTRNLPVSMTIGDIRARIPQYLVEDEHLRTRVNINDISRCAPPSKLTFRTTALADDETLETVISRVVDTLTSRDITFHGAFRVSVTNKDFNQTATVEIYNDMRLDEIRIIANQQLGEFAIDQDAQYENPAFNADSFVYDSSIFNDDSFVLFSAPFDVRVRFNNNLNTVTVHKNMTMKQLRDKIAAQYNLSTEFYIDIENGARLPLDNTRLHRMSIIDAKRAPVLTVTLQSGEYTQRLRYICQGCGGDVWRANNEDVRCRNCGSVILFKTRAANAITQYIAR